LESAVIPIHWGCSSGSFKAFWSPETDTSRNGWRSATSPSIPWLKRFKMSSVCAERLKDWRTRSCCVIGAQTLRLLCYPFLKVRELTDPTTKAYDDTSERVVSINKFSGMQPVVSGYRKCGVSRDFCTIKCSKNLEKLTRLNRASRLNVPRLSLRASEVCIKIC